MAVALGAHVALANRRGADTPCGCGIRVRAEHGYFGRLEPPFSEGCICDEAGQAASDDRARSRHGYLTDPARRPWTKYRWKAKKTMSGIASETNVAGAMISMLVPNAASWE
jgi:hypothetical protein